MDAGTQATMAERFGHDFSQVRVHADDRAATSARAVDAHAYTVGRDIAFAWGASGAAGGAEPLVGGVVVERSGSAMLLHGPVVTAGAAPIEIAAQLVAAALDHATAAGATTVFARPQSLDRVWVRFGFVPVPESTLPDGFGGPAGVGLYAWRGGSALWTLREHATA